MKSALLWISIISVGFAEDVKKPVVQVIFAPGARAAARPVEFDAPGGLTGVRLGEEFSTAATVTVASDGKLRMQCERLPRAIERVKARGAEATRGGEISNDR